MASMTNAEQQKKWREKKENELGREELRKKRQGETAVEKNSN